MPRTPRSILLIVTALVAISRVLLSEDTPRHAGVVEKATVTLVLLDVEVHDEKGRPLRGLKAEDFHLTLDRRAWPIYSVDDLCACGPSATTNGQAEGGEASGLPRVSEAAGSSAPMLYVIYLDFSQLQLGARSRAIHSVKRWLGESRGPGDEVMLVGYSTPTGLKELCPPTSELSRLEAALDAAAEDRALVDPFPEGFQDRIDECTGCLAPCMREGRCADCSACCPCLVNALEEHAQQRRSLKALKLFLTRLERIPGRKTVLFFHSNGELDPARFYPIHHPERVGKLEELLEEVGAEATTSRASIHPVQTGDSQFFTPLAASAVNFGANLADFTGGSYNRGPSDLYDVIARAGRGCSCTYRIAFEPPDASRTKVYEAVVKAAGRRVPYSYRAQSLAPGDRLMRKARAVLAAPWSAADLPIIATLTPRAATRGRWSVDVRLAIDIDGMRLLPSARHEVELVDVGALLHSQDGSDSWEMLTGSTVRKDPGADTGSFLLYEKAIAGLKPGGYRLTAFARGQEMDLFGGAEAVLDLPAPDKPALIGPFVVARRRVYAASLPLRSETRANAPAAAKPEESIAPADPSRVGRGTVLEAMTWICSGGEGPLEPSRLLRFVARDGVPVFRLGQPRLEPAGRCSRVTDEIDTRALAPGPYTYHLEWKDEATKTSLVGELSLTIAEALR